jgi:hypothetical protein
MPGERKERGLFPISGAAMAPLSPMKTRGLPILEHGMVGGRISLWRQLEELFIVLLGVQQPFGVRRRHGIGQIIGFLAGILPRLLRALLLVLVCRVLLLPLPVAGLRILILL